MNKLTLNADGGRHLISRHIYGHFAEHLGRCIYGGIWVGEDSDIPNTRGIRQDIVEALREIHIPNLRWPGGCFADEYHWKDGVGPRERRPTMVNTHWGGVTENNHFGTHEFMDLCDQLGCEPYICGNVGSGTVREMQEWVEYLTFDGQSPMADWRRENGRAEPWRVRFWGVGNENWGCGGNMTAEYYANEYRRYQTYLRNFGENRLYKIACGANGADYHWTEVLMRQAMTREVPPRPGGALLMHGLSLHYYTAFRGENGYAATGFGEEEWFRVLQKALYIDELVMRHVTIMDHYDPEQVVGLIVDEWGTWYKVEPGTHPRFLYQQNSLRDALVAGLTLNVFNRHCDRVHMANIAQTVNVLQALILTEGEKMIRTPTYHVFEMYKVHHNATLIPLDLQCESYTLGDESIPGLSASASKDRAGRIHISLCNFHPRRTVNLTCQVRGAEVTEVTGRILTADSINAHNTFDEPNVVVPAAFGGATLEGNVLSVRLPARCVVVLELQ